MAQRQVRAVVVGSDSFFYFKRDRLMSLAALARDGGLIAYGSGHRLRFKGNSPQE